MAENPAQSVAGEQAAGAVSKCLAHGLAQYSAIPIGG